MHRSSISEGSIAKMIEYADEGMAKYFGNSKVEGFFKDTLKMFRPLLPSTARIMILYDHKELPISLCDYFISLYSSYLTLRYDDAYVVKLYSPFKFSRQFA